MLVGYDSLCPLFVAKQEERKDNIQLFIDTITNTLVQSTKLTMSILYPCQMQTAVRGETFLIPDFLEF